MRNDPIGIFDSGAGGLNVLSRCERLMPEESYIYLADSANMPYGDKSEAEIKRAALGCADRLFSLGCKAIAVACNTATVTAIDDIRARFPDRISVGLEPAVKPCLKELGRNGRAIALVTPATARSEKFNRLIAGCREKITVLSDGKLASIIEDCVNAGGSLSAAEEYAYNLLAPHRGAEAIVLGCSHYSYIAEAIGRRYGGTVKIYDGAAGEAERLEYCLRIAGLRADGGKKTATRRISTARG